MNKINNIYAHVPLSITYLLTRMSTELVVFKYKAFDSGFTHILNLTKYCVIRSVQASYLPVMKSPQLCCSMMVDRVP